jgi:hypothetical protein
MLQYDDPRLLPRPQRARPPYIIDKSYVHVQTHFDDND